MILSAQDNFLQRIKVVTLLRYVLAFALATNPMIVFASVDGGVVAAGQASISTLGKETNINVATDRAVIDWNKFDINADERVAFAQPSVNSVTLNRIGGAASQINGRLEANGNIFIINSNGVVFGKGAQVNVGGLIATSSNIDNNRFMSGDYTFDQSGNSDAEISNAGSVTVRDHGLVALAGPNVTNSGYIRAKLGKVQLASGDTFAVDLYGDGLINLQASSKLKKQLVSNSGTLSANGGEVLMTAAAANGAINSVINMDGIIEAKSVGKQNGKVVLFAEGSNAVKGNKASDKGKKFGLSTAIVTGKIDVTGDANSNGGGSVDVLADHVGIFNGAVIDASGTNGGGNVRIGGDFHGEGLTATALRTIVQSNTSILANATANGNGGNVAVWADGHTDFDGKIEAKGGVLGGNGGFVETSGKETLGGEGLVDVSAVNGLAGNWLLDPYDITIGVSLISALPNFTSTNLFRTVSALSISTALGLGSNVTITTGSGTTGSNGGQLGNIKVSSSISKVGDSNATLTLNALNNIIVDKDTTIGTLTKLLPGNTLNVVFNADSDNNGTGSIATNKGSNISTNGGNVTFNAGNGISINSTIDTGTGTFIGKTANGDFVIQSNGKIISTAAGTAITIAALTGKFTNLNNFGALATQNGRWLVYSQRPADNTLGGLSSNFTQYKCNYNGSCPVASLPTSGNGLIYSDALGMITATPDTITLTYSDATPSLSGYGYKLSGYNEGDSALDTVTGSLTGSTTYAAGSDVGNYNVNYVSGSLASTLGYDFTYANNASAIIVNQKLINTVTLQGTVEKVYTSTDDADVESKNFSLSDIFGEDEVGISNTTGKYASANVGENINVTVDALALTGAKAGNYKLNQISASAELGKITPALLKVLADSKTLVYGNKSPALTFTTDGIQVNDTVESVLTGGLARVGGDDVGKYAITQGTLGLVEGNKNYTVTFTGNTYEITPATLTVLANSQTKIYGDIDPSLTYRVSGFKFDDSASNVLEGGLSRNEGENVGSYDITQGGLVSNKNYTINYTGSALEITPATLTVLANSQTKIYGDEDPSLTYQVSGFKFKDGAENVLEGRLGRDEGENVGSYDITQGGLLSNDNYTINYTGSALEITPATLTVIADVQTKTYGDIDPSLTYQVSGFKFKDGSENVLSGELDRDAGKNVGVYGINQGSLESNPNYTIGYTPNALTITKRDLTVTADGVDKVFNGNTIATVVLNDNRVEGDVFDVNSTSATFDNRNAGENKTVTVDGITISSPTLPPETFDPINNYNLLNTTATTTATITRAPLTITADDKSVISGQPLPALTFVSSVLAEGDTTDVLSGNLSTVPADSLAGVYDINQGSLNAGENYLINYVPGALTIDAPNSLINTTTSQGQTNYVPFNAPQGTNGTLLSLYTGGGNGGGAGTPGALNNINPAAGGEGVGSDLNAINPAAGGNGDSTPLIECTQDQPCQVNQ
ncbi:MAG: filamentous hemagglutinin N-terminal domain-containing protein [Alphaproteobacteria bacterium]|nr:filamentous hemagglutinin N-terminal domain-containing protein [Alphaproteobacteria bacterium]